LPRGQGRNRRAKLVRVFEKRKKEGWEKGATRERILGKETAPQRARERLGGVAFESEEVRSRDLHRRDGWRKEKTPMKKALGSERRKKRTSREG